MTFEYKVVPAPTRGRKAKGVKTPADRFARALEDTINELAAEGWEYQRTDTLPAEERQGLTGRTTIYQNMLVFRRLAETTENSKDRSVAAPRTPKALVPPQAIAPTAPAVPDTEPEIAPAREAGDRPDTARFNTLNSLIEREIAAARAPKLPSAGAAQELSAQRTGAALPKLTASRKDVAAE
ncbi:MAG: DUF4177 domain-containing protein [Paracoccaceae bacterium]